MRYLSLAISVESDSTMKVVAALLCLFAVCGARLNPKLGEIRTVTLCEGEASMDLTCEDPAADVLVEPEGVFWGRGDDVTCPRPTDGLTGPKCPASDFAARKINYECAWMRTCRLTPTTDELQDRCPSTFKYLQVTYQCMVLMR